VKLSTFLKTQINLLKVKLMILKNLEKLIKVFLNLLEKGAHMLSFTKIIFKSKISTFTLTKFVKRWPQREV